MPVRYHLFSVLSILATVPLRNFAMPLTPRWDETVVKHAWSAIPEYWESRGHSSASTTIDLYLALKSHHENALVDALYEVSSPEHPRYRAHLSKEQLAELVAPHPETLTLVNSWLEDHNISSSSVSTVLGGNWLKVTGVPLPRANKILGASYQLYQHAETNDTVLRTISYSLPKVLHGHIQTVAPTTYFGSPPRTEQKERRMHPSGESAAREEARSEGNAPEPFVTPSQLRSMYKTMGYVPAATDRNALGIAGYRMEYPSIWDLEDFMLEYRTDGEDATFSVVKINKGDYDPSNPGAEASQNMQYAEAMTYPTPHIFYSTGGGFSIVNDEPAPGDAYLEWFNVLLNTDRRNLPPTISISYGTPEWQIPQHYAWALCDLFGKLGARGVSILVGSGDDGVGRGDCKDKSGDVQFMTMFPASCPYVTSVGGTKRRDPEIAADLSGGGFSIHFRRPEYQDNSVLTFLNNFGDRYPGLFNPAGRGIPDISAQALQFLFIRNANTFATDGTSCATPVVAGVISLLNDYLLSKNEEPLGFLNPWLYGRGRPGLNDITSGSNPACGTEGFHAIVGWDPVTGLGTPDFEKLEEIIDAQLKLAQTQ